MHVERRASFQADPVAQNVMTGDAGGFLLGKAGQRFEGAIHPYDPAIHIEQDNTHRNLIDQRSQIDGGAEPFFDRYSLGSIQYFFFE